MKSPTKQEVAKMDYLRALWKVRYHKERGYNEGDAWSKWKYETDLATYERLAEVARLLVEYYEIEPLLPDDIMGNLEAFYRSLNHCQNGNPSKND